MPAPGLALMLSAGSRRNPHLPAVVDVAGRVDGLIAFAGAAPTEALARIARRIPVIELGGKANAEGARTVLVDNRTGMRQLVEHLLDVHRFRRFVYVGERGTAEFVGRFDGYADALRTAGPPLATLAILTFLGSWNNFLWPLVVAQSQDMYTLPVALSLYSTGQNATQYGILLAGSVLVITPMLLLFILLQRYFTQGIATTGIK